MSDQITILVEGLRAAIRDPECPGQFSPLLMECAQVLDALHPTPLQDEDVPEQLQACLKVMASIIANWLRWHADHRAREHLTTDDGTAIMSLARDPMRD